MKTILKEIKQELSSALELLVKFAADVLVSIAMLFLVAKSALLSHSFIEGMVAATHDPLVGGILSVSHVIVLGFHVIALVWVSFKSLKRFLKGLK